MTAALTTIARLDDGLTVSPADLAAIDAFDRHCSDRQYEREQRLDAYAADVCVICGRAGEGSECDSCTAGHDFHVSQAGDL